LQKHRHGLGPGLTGVVYLLYFLTAVSAEVFFGQSRLVAYEAVKCHCVLVLHCRDAALLLHG
jgi:hypothetical protein